MNGGYNRSVYWLRASAPRTEHRPGDPLWLEITPSYLDRVTLFPPGAHGWREQRSGDTVSMCDPTLVHIALSNLVDNALKYAQAGEIRIAAWLEARACR